MTIDFPFILRNYAGLLLARVAERVPASLAVLRNSRSRLKPFVEARLRSERLSQVVTTDIAGFRMRLHLRDRLQRMMYFGLYENEEIAWCRPLVREGGTCIDAGANVGWYTLHFARWVGPKGRVVALEADHEIAATLRENCELSRVDDRVEVVNCAVTENNGTLQFARSSAGGSGWGSADLSGNSGAEVINVAGVTLDSILATRSIAEVDLLKIDVESHEFAVLAGASQSLQRRAFRNVLIEWEGYGQTRNFRRIEEMTAIFDASGYTPSAQTAKLLDSLHRGLADPRRVCVNLLYHRADC